MDISLEKIKSVREKTLAPIGDIKEALEESRGDEEKAIKKLIDSGAAKASKRAGREAKNGIVDAYIHAGKIGVLIEVNCETDFVARNENFKAFVHDLALHIASMRPIDVAELLTQDFVKDNAKKIQDLVNEKTATIGEKIVINRFEVYELGV